MEELSFNRPQSVGPCGPVWSYQGSFFLGVDSVLHVIIPAISQLECQDVYMEDDWAITVSKMGEQSIRVTKIPMCATLP